MIKRSLVQLMLRTSDGVQRQLSEAIAVIGREDFPDKWSDLLSLLTQHLAGDDMKSICACLLTADSLFRCVIYITHSCYMNAI